MFITLLLTSNHMLKYSLNLDIVIMRSKSRYIFSWSS